MRLLEKNSIPAASAIEQKDRKVLFSYVSREANPRSGLRSKHACDGQPKGEHSRRYLISDDVFKRFRNSGIRAALGW